MPRRVTLQPIGLVADAAEQRGKRIGAPRRRASLSALGPLPLVSGTGGGAEKRKEKITWPHNVTKLCLSELGALGGRRRGCVADAASPRLERDSLGLESPWLDEKFGAFYVMCVWGGDVAMPLHLSWYLLLIRLGFFCPSLQVCFFSLLRHRASQSTSRLNVFESTTWLGIGIGRVLVR